MFNMNEVYLISYAVKGIKNLDEWVFLSFYKKTIKKDFDVYGYNLKGIYGANGSGKTGIITSVKILKRLLLEQHYLSGKVIQDELNALINRKTGKLEIAVEYLFPVQDALILFNYEIKVGRNSFGLYEIESEKLSYKNATSSSASSKLCFSTDHGNLQIHSADVYAKLVDELTKNLLAGSAMASIVRMNDRLRQPGSEMENVLWIMLMSLIIFALSLNICTETGDDHRNYHLSNYLDSENSPNNFDLKSMIQQIDKLKGPDTGMFSAELISVPKRSYGSFEKHVNKLYEFLHIFKNDLAGIDIDKKDDGENYVCTFIMNYGDYSVDAEFESAGIKKLIRLFYYIENAVNGNIVFIDELDSSLHDVYLCALLEYLKDNAKGQLCFTTHNVGPMDILKTNKKSIDFLSTDHKIYSWAANGNYSPAALYKKGMIEGSPFNVFPFDFANAFYTEDEQ